MLLLLAIAIVNKETISNSCCCIFISSMNSLYPLLLRLPFCWNKPAVLGFD